MSSVTLLSQPNFLSPLNADVWFNTSSPWSTNSNFKYLYNVRQYFPSNSVVMEDLGTYPIPPSPTGDAFFSPSKILKTHFTYVPSFQTIPYAQAEEYYIKYAVRYGLDADLVLGYYDEFFASSFVGLTFSYAHGLIPGMEIEVTAFSTVNPQYNTASTITSVPNDFAVITDIPWGTSGPTIGGEVRILYYDTIQYISSQGSLGLTFSGTHFFQVGDVITIDKNDKVIDIEYDGTASIVAATTYSIALDREFLGTQSVSGVNGGYISKLRRFSGTSSIAYGYNGTRQYDEYFRDFGLSYSIGIATMTSNGATAAAFLSNYEGWRPVKDGSWESHQGFTRTGQSLTLSIETYNLRTYDDNMNLLISDSIAFNPTYSQMWTFGTGPENIKQIFGATALNGASYYEVFLTDVSSG